MDKEEIIRRIRENYEEIRKFGVKRIGIFGSIVRGEAREDSDIDILVEFEDGKKTFENFINLALFLGKLLGREIDLLTPKSVSPYIRPYIEKEVVFV